MKVETVIGDKAYSSKENVDAAKDNHYELISRLNSIVTQGNRIKPDEFEFNVKDVFIRRVVIKKEQKGKPTQKH